MQQEQEERKIKDEAKRIFMEERNEGQACIDFSLELPNKSDFLQVLKRQKSLQLDVLMLRDPVLEDSMKQSTSPRKKKASKIPEVSIYT